MSQPSRPTAALIIMLGTLTAFGPLSIDMYLPGLPAIARDLGADPGVVQLTLSLFFIGLAVGQAFYGPLADRFGRKAPLLAGCALYALASAACALAPTAPVLVAARLAQALGGAAGRVIARSVVRGVDAYYEDGAFYVTTPTLAQPGPWGAAVAVRDPATGVATGAKLQFTVSEGG
ncbi:MAG: multidrug effflux MFS transporter, partial [Chloroflexales bacterium]|nr:multidrug effflux MFS transporter [Chloroflexales bacterium]